MVGSAVVRASVDDFYRANEIEIVIFAAGKVGGIHANSTYPAEFMQQNIAMGMHNIDAAYRNGVERFLYLGSTCIYPRNAPQPMPENCLLSSPLEKTNEAYALAKIAGLKMCEFYRQQYGVLFHSAMPTNLYGPGDNYHPENSHVLPCTLDNPPDLVNVGTGSDVTILELAQKIAAVVSYQGEVKTDPSKPDGTPVKRTDMTLMHNSGWSARTDLDTGLKLTYENFLAETVAETLRQA